MNVGFVGPKNVTDTQKTFEPFEESRAAQGLASIPDSIKWVDEPEESDCCGLECVVSSVASWFKALIEWFSSIFYGSKEVENPLDVWVDGELDGLKAKNPKSVILALVHEVPPTQMGDSSNVLLVTNPLRQATWASDDQTPSRHSRISTNGVAAWFFIKEKDPYGDSILVRVFARCEGVDGVRMLHIPGTHKTFTEVELFTVNTACEMIKTHFEAEDLDISERFVKAFREAPLPE